MKVNWDDDIPNIWENEKMATKPPTANKQWRLFGICWTTSFSDQQKHMDGSIASGLGQLCKKKNSEPFGVPHEVRNAVSNWVVLWDYGFQTEWVGCCNNLQAFPKLLQI